jgi:hypothetical protein
MAQLVENGVRYYCNECRQLVRRALRDEQPFAIKDVHEDGIGSREVTLTFIIKTLYQIEDNDNYPNNSRKKTTERLMRHGQFQKNEIDQIFDKYAYDSSQFFTEEFYESHDVDEIRELLAYNEAVPPGKEIELPSERRYNLPGFSCDSILDLGFCTVSPEIIECPDCKEKVANTPDNVSGGFTRDLVCPKCSVKNKQWFENKGLIRIGNPMHHGNWGSTSPEFHFSETDYFCITHHDCPKSDREDRCGIMWVNGVWIDDCSRIVLGLICMSCGARNALKPWVVKGRIPVLNSSGARWDRFDSLALELINCRENGKIEYKSTLRWDLMEKEVNPAMEMMVAKTIAAFMNTDDGYLVIGVDDLRNVLGLDDDVRTLGEDATLDEFELHLTDIICNNFGREKRAFIDVDFEKVESKDVCLVHVRPSPEPVFLRDGSFYYRAGNRCQKLSGDERDRYISNHW